MDKILQDGEQYYIKLHIPVLEYALTILQWVLKKTSGKDTVNRMLNKIAPITY